MMRADLIERLRDPNYAGAMQHLRDAHELDALLNEAADALASLSSPQEPVAWQYRFMIANEWAGWVDLKGPPERFRTQYDFNFENGTAELRALVVASPVEPVAAKAEAEAMFEIEHDGFRGTQQGSYVTREGKRGVVLQQIGTRVVHVYGEKWLKPAAPTCEGEGQ